MSTPRQAVVIGGEIVAPGVRRVRFRMAGTERLGHRAGQYVLLHARAGDGSVVKRAYSIATPTADDPEFELCARLIIDQPASTFVHGLAAGGAVKFSGPWGKFVVDDETRDLTLAATGTAISCTGAILRDELARGRPRRVRLLWGLRHETDAHGAPMLEELTRAHPRFSYRIVLSRAGERWTGARGRVTDALRAEARAAGLYYLAGNGAMIADAEDVLAEAGVPAASIRKEAFFTPGQVRVPVRERQARAANRERAGRAVVGVALHAGVPTEEVVAAIAAALALGNLSAPDVRNLAAASKASDEPGLAGAATKLGVPVEFYLPAEVEGGATTGSSSACETLARLSAGSSGLLVPKYKTAAVTVAIAVVAGRSGQS